MKVVFVGPSLPDAAALAAPDIRILPPARQGDVMTAISEGATAIGLIDGEFELVAPVWHKELLYALSRGLPVYGAASMGALRAAECSAFGMTGIGAIFEDYRSGRRFDDGDVALDYGPAELGYPAVSVPLVNVDATLAHALETGLISGGLHHRMAEAARAIFFKDRTWKAIATGAGQDWQVLRPLIRQAWRDQKRADAIALLDALAGPVSTGEKPDWTFNATPLWRELYN